MGHTHSDACNHAGQHHQHVSKTEKAQFYNRAFRINLTVWLIQLFAIFVLSAGSLALLGDWAHGGADLLILYATYWVTTLEVKNPKDDHARKKKLLTCVAVAILFATAWYVLDEALDRIFNPPLFHGWLVGSLAILSTIGNLYAHKIIDKVDKCEHDGLHHANVAHLLSDAAISFAVFVSAVGNVAFGLPAVDGFASIFVGIWIIIVGKRILFDKHHH